MLPGLHIPDTHRHVLRSRHDQPAIRREIDRVNLLLVSFKHLPDAFLSNVPYLTREGCIQSINIKQPHTHPNLLILGPCHQQLAIGAKRQSSNIHGIAHCGIVDEDTGGRISMRGRGRKAKTHHVFAPVFVS